jgi:deazaflavin-dependent oxidoreductase (nitroreductase family)
MAETNGNDWNRQVIEEFRANGGKVGGMFEGMPLLLLTTSGAKSGQQRLSPLVYFPDGEQVFIFASKGGAPTNPDWYHNLVAHPRVTIEIGTEQFEATAVTIEGEARDQIYAKLVQRMPQFGDYASKTTRKIPVVELVRRTS